MANESVPRGPSVPVSSSSAARFHPRRIALALGLGIAVWAVVAYIVLPAAWRWRMHRHPALQGMPRVAVTGNDIPGDPLNLAFVGPEESLHRGMAAAGWHAADPITLASSLRIIGDTVFRKPDIDAPVSNLFVWGKKQDLAFEVPVGNDPRKRHHVRFWRSPTLDAAGQPLWVGAATYDERVGFSHTTGQITHHIGPDVDAERDRVAGDLQKAGWLLAEDWIDDFHTNHEGRNGGGDPYKTDGRLLLGDLKAAP